MGFFSHWFHRHSLTADAPAVSSPCAHLPFELKTRVAHWFASEPPPIVQLALESLHALHPARPRDWDGADLHDATRDWVLPALQRLEAFPEPLTAPAHLLGLSWRYLLFTRVLCDELERLYTLAWRQGIATRSPLTDRRDDFPPTRVLPKRREQDRLDSTGLGALIAGVRLPLVGQAHLLAALERGVDWTDPAAFWQIARLKTETATTRPSSAAHREPMGEKPTAPAPTLWGVTAAPKPTSVAARSPLASNPDAGMTPVTPASTVIAAQSSSTHGARPSAPIAPSAPTMTVEMEDREAIAHTEDASVATPLVALAPVSAEHVWPLALEPESEPSCHRRRSLRRDRARPQPVSSTPTLDHPTLLCQAVRDNLQALLSGPSFNQQWGEAWYHEDAFWVVALPFAERVQAQPWVATQDTLQDRADLYQAMRRQGLLLAQGNQPFWSRFIADPGQSTARFATLLKLPPCLCPHLRDYPPYQGRFWAKIHKVDDSSNA